VIGEWVYCHVENQVLRMHVRLFSVYQLFPYDYDFPIMSGMTRPDRILLLQRQANDRLLIGIAFFFFLFFKKKSICINSV